MNNVIHTIINKIKELNIPCPECENTYYNKEYTCDYCYCQGGDGKINVIDYIKDHPEILKILGILERR